MAPQLNTAPHLGDLIRQLQLLHDRELSHPAGLYENEADPAYVAASQELDQLLQECEELEDDHGAEGEA